MNQKQLEALIGMEAYKSKTAGIGGVIKQLPDDFIVEEITPDKKVLEVKLSSAAEEHADYSHRGEFTHCVLRKYNWDNMRAVKEISKRLGLSGKRIGFAGTKDKRAVTAQQISFYNVPVEDLMKVNIKDITLRDFRYADDKIDLGDLWGNRFTITVRNINESIPQIEVEDRVRRISGELKYGFPNFFGEQRFGTVRPITHLVGKEILKGDFKRAVMIYLSDVYEGENAESAEARKKLAETMDFKDALKNFPRNLGYELSMINHLVEHEGDYTGALKVLPKTLSMMFVHAYQGFIFNKALSKCINGGFYVERLPLVGYLTAPDELSAGILEVEGITQENFRVKYLNSLSSKGEVRDCFIPVHDFTTIQAGADELNTGKNKITIRFSLNKGCYATSLLRELMKN